MNSDWPERFRSLELQEMRYDIQMIECHLPDPWYRVPVAWGVTFGMFGGMAAASVGGGYFFTGWAVWAGVMLVCGLVGILLAFLTLERYEYWTDDPCSLILDKKMYRETEATKGRAAFKSHSQVNAHTLNTIEAAREADELANRLEREEQERKGAEISAEIYRFASLSEEDKFKETLHELEINIAKALVGDSVTYYRPKRQDAPLIPLWAVSDNMKREIVLDQLEAEGWIH